MQDSIMRIVIHMYMYLWYVYNYIQVYTTKKVYTTIYSQKQGIMVYIMIYSLHFTCTEYVGKMRCLKTY